MEFFDEEECPGCECERTIKELEDQWNSELEIFYQRTDWKLDFNEFYYFAEAGEIARMNLVGLPGLQENYDYAMDNLKTYQQEEYDYANRQLSLFNDGLPF
jgi:hypothetical protein